MTSRPVYTALTSVSEGVVAVGEKRRIWMLTLDDLRVQSADSVSARPFKAKAAAIQSGWLCITGKE